MITKLCWIARNRGGKTSADEPEAIAIAGPPQKPAKNLVTSKAEKLLENPAPSTNNMNSSIVTLYTTKRPYISLGPAATAGPKPSPNTYKLSGRMAVVVET